MAAWKVSTIYDCSNQDSKGCLRFLTESSSSQEGIVVALQRLTLKQRQE